MGILRPQDDETNEGLERVITLLPIPEWMFDERPHLFSRNDPASLCYDCPVCGRILPKRVRNGYMRRACACERALHEERLQKGAKEEYLSLVSSARAGRTYSWLSDPSDRSRQPPANEFLEERSFANFTRAYQKQAYDECKDWVKNFLSARMHREQFSLNLLLVGSYGTGKTHLAAAILNALRTEGVSCLFCTAQGFFNALYGRSFEGKLALQEQAAMTPVLVLDEIDKLYVKHAADPEMSGSFQKATLAEFLDRRWKSKRPTIITTNEQEDLGLWLNGATISRLHENLTALRMNGVDYRSRPKEVQR